MTVTLVMQEAGAVSHSLTALTQCHIPKKIYGKSLDFGITGKLEMHVSLLKTALKFHSSFFSIKMYYKGKLQSRRSFLSINCRRNTLVRSNRFRIHVCTLVTEHTPL